MVDIVSWIEVFKKALQKTFPDRVCFIGLQGSYARGDATENSDINVVVILDRLSSGDVKSCGEMLDALPHRELICCFLSDRDDLRHWESSDLFQFYNDTKPIKGDLNEFLPPITEADLKLAIKKDVSKIYNACVRNMIHEKNESVLKRLYLSASIAIQSLWYLQSGEYVGLRRDLLNKVNDREKDIIFAYQQIKKNGAGDFELLSEKLFDWSKYWVSRLDK